MRFSAVLVLAFLVVASAGCGCGDDDDEGNRVHLVVDESVSPLPATIPALDGEGDEPLAAVVDASGLMAPFVENQIVVMTSDDAELQAVVSRWNGEVIASYDPAERGLDGVPAMHVVRVASAAPDTSLLPDDLVSIDPQAQGDLCVSSERGLATLAVAARESATGHVVAINWVASDQSFRDRTTTEATSGPGGYTPNAFDWSYMRADGALGVGVGESWRALDLAVHPARGMAPAACWRPWGPWTTGSAPPDRAARWPTRPRSARSPTCSRSRSPSSRHTLPAHGSSA